MLRTKNANVINKLRWKKAITFFVNNSENNNGQKIKKDSSIQFKSNQ